MTAPATAMTVRVAQRRVEAEDVCSFELVSTDGSELPAFDAGAHLDVLTPAGQLRQYSLANAPVERHRYLIGVLREADSRGGSLSMHLQLRVGDRLPVSLPRNHFALAPAAPFSLLLAGGIGLTPLLAMAEALHASGQAFALHVCVRSRTRLAFSDRLVGSAWADSVHLHIDDETGRPDLTALLAGAPAGAHAYVCGPGGFLDAVREHARMADWDDARVHFEYFSHELAPADHSGAFDVRIHSSGQVIHVEMDQTIVQALAANGVTVLTSCEQGVCGTCLTRVLEGVPEHRDAYLTAQEQAANDQCLPCCARAKTPLLVLDL